MDTVKVFKTEIGYGLVQQRGNIYSTEIRPTKEIVSVQELIKYVGASMLKSEIWIGGEGYFSGDPIMEIGWDREWYI